MKLRPAWFDDKTIDCDQRPDECDQKAEKLQKAMHANADKAHKLYMISEFARWATLAILAGATTGIIGMIGNIADAGAFYGAIAGLAAVVGVGSTVAVTTSLYSNRISSQKELYNSAYMARAVAKEIEKVGTEKEQIIEANIPAPSPQPQFANRATPVVDGRGLEYIHTLMEPSSVLQSRS